ncbi:MAG TPA: cell envelope integrity protein CreD [Chitinophagaceae bacterium]|nr:cell envelope integrity protein CreD [Chitinophagaceae bacterium]
MEQDQSTTGQWARSLWDKGKLFLKCAVIFITALVLWIPTSFILNLVKERKERQAEAVADISSKWAGQQTITGPLLNIPYDEITKDEKGNTVILKRDLWFMPDKLDIKTKIYPEKRHRGIYHVAVYRSDVSINIKFNPLKWQDLKIPSENIRWAGARLLFRVTDNIKGVNDDININWDGNIIPFNPRSTGTETVSDGYIAEFPFSAEAANTEHTGSMSFSINGSEKLLFTASGRENKVEMNSSWKNPSFTGVKLPDTREVGDTGFTATWKYLNRSVPQVWKDNFYDLSASVVGADLLISVDSYEKTERSVKYAILCIILTFASFFLIETIYKKPLHLIQYALAGLALVLFYTLLLSISEYIGFNPAYGIAAVATISLVAWYMGSILRSSKLALFISFVLTVVYTYIFIIIQLQDYALLMGSIGLFIALGIIMYFSRKLQWT